MLPIRWLPALLCLLAAPVGAQGVPPEAQAYLDDWVIVDDESGEAEAVMRIYASGGKAHGRIVRSLAADAPDGGAVPCVDCEGEFEGADLREVPLLRDMEWEGDGFGGGRIFDPRSGRGYKCVMELEGTDRLRVRGYLGIRALGRTQVWRRVD